MIIDYNSLQNKDARIHVVAYNKHIYSPDDVKRTGNSKALVHEAGKLFDFHQGFRIAGGLAIYAHNVGCERYNADVDINIDESHFLDVVSIAEKKGYVLCRQAQREIRQGVRLCVFEEITPRDFISKKPDERIVLLKTDADPKGSPINIIDVFISYIDKAGWECTYDKRLSPIIPVKECALSNISFPEGNVRLLPLEYIATLKSILISDIDRLGAGNKLDFVKNKFDLNNVLKLLDSGFREKLKEIMEKRKKIRG
ncbi:MAG: hypothetical protein KKG59_00795 [Nanoarchaeota archaeon]|nr:hypothetical protein [Nanoarchaeota archaeon]